MDSHSLPPASPNDHALLDAVHNPEAEELITNPATINLVDPVIIDEPQDIIESIESSEPVKQCEPFTSLDIEPPSDGPLENAVAIIAELTTGSQLDYFINLAKEAPFPVIFQTDKIEWGIEFCWDSRIKKAAMQAGTTMGGICQAICSDFCSEELMHILICVVEYKRHAIAQFKRMPSTPHLIAKSLKSLEGSQFWNSELGAMELDGLKLRVISNLKDETST
ncbi:hypothetical protein HDU99_004608, partial [Rhizoclosmatium hyalinum]